MRLERIQKLCDEPWLTGFEIPTATGRPPLKPRNLGRHRQNAITALRNASRRRVFVVGEVMPVISRVLIHTCVIRIELAIPATLRLHSCSNSKRDFYEK
jgi:hypothetical protein